MSVGIEKEQTQRLMENVDAIEEVAGSLPSGAPGRSKLYGVAADLLASARPIRPVVAADLLELTEKTVRAWANEGVLVISEAEPTMRLEPQRVHEVLRLVRELRGLGRTRGLLDEVHRRLSDQALLDRADLSESLNQMAEGNGRVVRTK
ncbi:hypothetical protein GCM10010174_03960 [Kutzneria viridogrisea]|uniref:HTH merR-type domain-containing protein n=2 Tax=Kutzneria TaxID=43356 RepID=W5W057_9PSEU|nr:MerR family transcriptional regulator [Kutzneria albida]AHH94197.1 hypothetical protein KALB_823 [Kutzneria albida DSM 43870]MBA8929870.1 DNA-binding transcriptional MerR regulator [Kutzneria viridogrisea]